MSRHIAGRRLRRFYIRSHIYGYPRAAKSLPWKMSFHCMKDIIA